MQSSGASQDMLRAGGGTKTSELQPEVSISLLMHSLHLSLSLSLFVCLPCCLSACRVVCLSPFRQVSVKVSAHLRHQELNEFENIIKGASLCL